jgi:leucyl aminopeptidase
VALGPDLPPFYTNDEMLARDVAIHARQENDPLWRLRLWLDIYGWTPSAKPARPEGGEWQAARAIYKLMSERYG